MHKLRIVGDSHVDFINGPRHILGENFSIVSQIANARATPVFSVDEIRILQCVHLVVVHRGVAHKQRVELVTLWMCHHEINVCSAHPFGKTVGHGLRQCAGMWRPSQDHFRTLLLLVLLDGYEVGKGLQWVCRSALHRKDRAVAVFHKLHEDAFRIVGLAVGKSGKRTYTNEVAVRCHHRNSLQEVFTLVSVHDHATLRFQFPCPLVHVEHNNVQTEVACRFLR